LPTSAADHGHAPLNRYFKSEADLRAELVALGASLNVAGEVPFGGLERSDNITVKSEADLRAELIASVASLNVAGELPFSGLERSDNIYR
jgi:hypothetical protein